MKMLLGLWVLIAAGIWVHGQTNSVAKSASQVQTTQRKLDRRFLETPITQAGAKLAGRNERYSGVLVDMARSQRPVRMLNPFRAENSGKDTANVLRDPRTGQAQGLALLSIRF
jgi:hypothetical protein